jgi:hypothetical protein
VTAEWGIPDPPSFSPELLAKCRASGDFGAVFFEWYKFVALLSNLLARVRSDSPALAPLPAVHYAVLVGMLNRNARLMLSNVALSHEGQFGETTAILDRCIFETCVKVMWLCSRSLPDAFERVLADGLKTELELEKEVRANIAKRGGQAQKIEKRMLRSIGRAIQSSGLTPEQVANAKKLPDLAAMISSVGHGRLMYVVGQRLGSHHVHGTWVSLASHYLEPDDTGVLRPRDADCRTHVNQLMFVPLAVLWALSAFVEFAFVDPEIRAAFSAIIDGSSKEILEFAEEDAGEDFETSGTA